MPLSSGAIDVLQRAHEPGNREELIFPSRTGRLIDGTTLSSVPKRLEVGGAPHGFRSSSRDRCGETGVPRDLTEACLAHWVGNQVEAAYARSDLL